MRLTSGISLLWIAVSMAFLFQWGCSEKKSLAQQRLGEWLPTSARELVSVSTGNADDTTFITFVCSASDMNILRGYFAGENGAIWRRKPFDRRTGDILNFAINSLRIEPRLQPTIAFPDAEYLQLPESKPYLPTGHAIILDNKQSRFWYIESRM